MPEAVIRLDKSKPYSECRGERAPDDPHYRVHTWQGQMVGKAMVLLPFDSQGVLVPDDGRTEQYAGMVEGKPVMHHPLYTQAMRDMVARKKQRTVAAVPGSGAGSASTDEENDNDQQEPAVDPAEDVNFASWLKGETTYAWTLLQKAYKTRYHIANPSKRDMVYDLVNDHHLVQADEVCGELAPHLRDKQAA